MSTAVNEISSIQKSKRDKRIELLVRGTVAFLLVSAVASLYEAIFLIPKGSPFVVPIVAFGVLKTAVAFLVLKGRTRALLTAAIVAVISIASDVTFAGDHYAAIALFIAPQILVIIFSLLAFREKRKLVALGTSSPKVPPVQIA
jgi:hypothetical protein